MGIFSREKPEISRKTDEATEERLGELKDEYDKSGTGHYDGGRFHKWPQSHYDRLLWAIDDAQKELDKMRKEGHKEALQLNEEYDLLRKRAEEAIQDLYNFEKNKLGMYKTK